MTSFPFVKRLPHALPRQARALFRANEVWLAVAAAIVGGLCGLLVGSIAHLVGWLQALLFRQGASEVSGATSLEWWVLLWPVVGGLLISATIYLSRRWKDHVSTVDPIEGNALYGGRIGWLGSCWITLQTVISHGFGASVGMEGAYTQICSATGSAAGKWLHARRADMRLLVACGAAASVSAVFDAPVSGVFYAFELVLASYAISNLAPVVIAAVASLLTRRAIYEKNFVFNVPEASPVLSDFVGIAVAALIATLFAIGLMRLTTFTSAMIRRVSLPDVAAPVIGGMVVAALAFVTPMALSSGSGALMRLYSQEVGLLLLLTIILCKSAAVIVSVATGFRGGLSFASFFLGAMVGKAVFMTLQFAGTPLPSAELIELVALTAMATAIIGAPLGMAFFALESSGQLSLLLPLVGTAVASALIVRRMFGFSFATWRFHLRGEAIRSAADVGWIRDLTVGRMMRRDHVPAVRADVQSMRRRFPPGSKHRVAVTDEDGMYLGVLSVPELHSSQTDNKTLEEILRLKHHVLLPEMNAKEAMQRFAASESDALAVVQGGDSRKVIGVLTEHHLLRRYTELADQRRQEIFGR